MTRVNRNESRIVAQEDVYLNADFVRFYDWSYAGTDADVSFYVDLARVHSSPVLEVACGTGRIAIALARHGFCTVGIDFSKHMLEIAEGKRRHEPVRVRELSSFQLADMRDFNLGKRFPSVLVPNAAVFHLDGRVSLLECFSSLREHTEADGILVIDVVSPRRMANQTVGEEVLVSEGVNPLTGLHTREFNRKLLIDSRSQIVRVEHVYTEKRGEEDTRYTFQQDYRWIEHDEGIDLLRRAGFTEIETMGNYKGAAYSADSPRLILKARGKS
jgi:SAM-dependent methyltransferase